MDMQNVVIREIYNKDLTENFLNDFNRYQEVTRVWRTEGKLKVIRKLKFIEDWNIIEKHQLISNDLTDVLHNNGNIYGAYVENKLIGFASLGSELLGNKKEYLQLLELHVSHEYRGNSIGKLLFSRCVDKLKELGVRKLYISSHSAIETKAFYDRMGCVDAKWIYDKQVEKEPYDCQLEYEI